MAGDEAPTGRECQGRSLRHTVACYMRAGIFESCTISPRTRCGCQPCGQIWPNSPASRGEKGSFGGGSAASQAWRQRECLGYPTKDPVVLCSTRRATGGDARAASVWCRCRSPGREWGHFVASRGVEKSFGDGRAASRAWCQRGCSECPTTDPVVLCGTRRATGGDARAASVRCTRRSPGQERGDSVAFRSIEKSFGDCHAASRTWCQRERPEYPTTDPVVLCSTRRATRGDARAASVRCRCRGPGQWWGDFVASRGVEKPFGGGCAASRTCQRERQQSPRGDPVVSCSILRETGGDAHAAYARC